MIKDEKMMAAQRRTHVEPQQHQNHEQQQTKTNKKLSTISTCFVINPLLLSLCLTSCVISPIHASGGDQDYFYTRTRDHPHHLRISEDYKNDYVDEVKFESTINGTKWEYYKSNQVANFDELVFETIDKIFRHRLAPFYIHHYDNDEDRKRSSDQRRVSPEMCARDLLYLLDKLHGGPEVNENHQRQQHNAGIKKQRNKDNFLTPELSAFFDSYARPESGVLMGNTYWVGAYDQCVSRHIFDLVDSTGGKKSSKRSKSDQQNEQQVVSFKGRYCVASLKSPLWDDLIAKRKLKSKNYFKTSRQIEDYSKLFRLQLGICLPDSCDSLALDKHHDEIKFLTKYALDSSERFADYNLIDLYCLPDDSSPLRQWSSSALAFLIIVGLWILLVLLATIADVGEFINKEKFPLTTNNCVNTKDKNKGPGQSTIAVLVGSLSLRANYRKIMYVSSSEHGESPADKRACNDNDSSSSSCREPDNRLSTSSIDETSSDKKTDDALSGSIKTETKQNHATQQQINLRFLNAFKVMIMFWIVNGHIMMLMIQTAKNILDSDALLNGLMHFLIGATFGVDLFFTMTGFLTTYLLFNSGHALKMRLSTWLYLTFHRYWRLAPMYLLTFWFSRSLVQLLGSGPLWDYGTSAITYRGLCGQESWWFPFTLTSNLHGLFEECVITSWYISCDMQFWLISPLFLHLLAHHPLAGWIASLTTIAASSQVRYNSIMTDKSARYDELVQPRADIFMRVSHDLPALYTHPHYRVSAYIVGLLAGHYVYMIKSGHWKSSLIPYGATTQGSSVNIEQEQTDQEVTKQKLSAKSKCSAIDLASRRKNILAYCGLTLFLLMAFASYLLANYFPTPLIKYAREISGYAYAVDHLIMSFGASLIIVTMCLGQWPRLVGWLSHPNWTRLSKVNYALLLLQCEAIYFQIFRFEQVPVAGTRELINILFNLLVTLYPLAFVVSLLIEFPLANLEKLLIKGKKKDDDE